MAKRHHSSHSGHYEGHHDRRKQEMEDSGMIREDHSAIANMPQEVMMKSWVGKESYLPEDLDDTTRGIDHQIGLDDNRRKHGFAPKKV